ncbi:histidine kinase [Dyadobacter sp. LHD-138]|uniref:sensor histidine kinase n=1 Tax=Dyadobacter sp. LHD-138 TaxID=3071413 RepID=UPI0027E16381|nr:histidine kinase [Dyadobacter sp. LHD-138]MDQ6479210.1 histidine kinase [Dyadobacter sp. LHD-138]
MNASLPLQNLYRLNLLMTIFINLFVFVILIISKVESITFVVMTFIRGCIMIYLLGLSNIYTLRFWRARYPQSHKKGLFFRYLFGTILSLSIYAILIISFSILSGKQNELSDQRMIITHFVSYVIFSTLMIVMQNQVLLQHSKTQAELENMQLKAAVSEASNFLLRQQIHPHFLFNSLTILKSLYKKDTEKGEFYLTKLANFLRASISDHASKISSLQTELTLCMDYMEMQKIRFGDAIEYNINVSQQARSKFVPFFSIQVLLENTIKHNALTEENPLKINVSDDGDFITVENNLQVKSNKEVSTGLGLANLAERYKLLSGDKIDIKQSAESFSVTIKMYENENYNH